MADSTRLFATLDQLIDGWCERRALDPLRVVLSSYPMAGHLTDDWAMLWDAIRQLMGLAPDVLRPEESAAVAEAHALIYQLLKSSPAGVGILEAAGF